MIKKTKAALKETVFRTSTMLERFRDEAKGVAAIEFALIAPLMCLMYVGTIELSAAVSVNRKMSRISSTIGDLVAQTPVPTSSSTACITHSTLNDFVGVSDEIMYPYTDNTKIVISVIEVAGGNATVKESRPYGGATAETIGAPYTLPTQIASTDGYLVVAQVNLNYMPLYGFGKMSPGRVFSMENTAIPMEEKIFLRPRIGDAIEFKASCPT